MFKLYHRTERLATETLLATGGCLLFVCAIVVYNPIAHVWPAGAPEDPFLRGEYYFNHDADVGGPYDLEKARVAYMEAIESDPDGYPLAWYQLGRIDFIEGKFDAALYKFDKQIEYFGDRIPNVYYMIGLTHGFKAGVTGGAEEWEAAARGFETFLGYEPQSPWARTDLSWVYFSQGKYAEMLPVLEEGLWTHPSNPWLLNMYGLALLNTGKRAEAHKQFLRAGAEAAKLTVEDWGRAYPGNDPAAWRAGLASFRDAIEKNRALTQGS